MIRLAPTISRQHQQEALLADVAKQHSSCGPPKPWSTKNRNMLQQNSPGIQSVHREKITQNDKLFGTRNSPGDCHTHHHPQQSQPIHHHLLIHHPNQNAVWVHKKQLWIGVLLRITSWNHQQGSGEFVWQVRTLPPITSVSQIWCEITVQLVVIELLTGTLHSKKKR